MLAVLCLGAALPAQDTGYVKARGKPGAAAIFINGNYVGPAYRFTVPEKYATPAGTAELTFRDPRYEDYTVKVSVSAHKTTKIHYAMKKLPVPQPPFGRFNPPGRWRARIVYVHRRRRHEHRVRRRQILRLRGRVERCRRRHSDEAGHLHRARRLPLFGDFRRDVTITANKVTVVPLPESGRER